MIAVALIAAGLWTGAIVFHSAIVAPAVFRMLDEAAARSFLRAVFPRFFRFGLGCGVVMATAIAVTAGWSTSLLRLATVVFAMLTLQAISLSLVPLINAARDAGERGAVRFTRLHRLSVLLTVAVLMLGLGFIAIAGVTAGLPEQV